MQTLTCTLTFSTHVQHIYRIKVKAPFRFRVMELQEMSLHLKFDWMVSSQCHVSSDEVKSHRASLKPIGPSQKRWRQACPYRILLLNELGNYNILKDSTDALPYCSCVQVTVRQPQRASLGSTRTFLH